jgi:peptide/nickel transport system permease protein
MRGSILAFATDELEYGAASMTVVADAGTQVEVADQPKPVGWLAKVRQFSRRNPLGAAGALVILIMLVVAVLANVIAPYNPVANAFDQLHQPPSLEHWLGTDQFGRDVLSRLIYGARTALLVGFVASFVEPASARARRGERLFRRPGRLVFQRVLDVFMAFPLIILALAVIAIFGSGTQNVIVAITIPFSALRPGRALVGARHPRDAHIDAAPRQRLQPLPHHPAPYGVNVWRCS